MSAQDIKYKNEIKDSGFQTDILRPFSNQSLN